MSKADADVLVSVVIPSFNAARWLPAALESLDHQDHPGLEVIVIDDGSTDETGAIAMRASRARYHRQRNAGPASARNTGIAMARGEYITFLDADDALGPNRISAQLGHLRDHPEIGCVLARHELLLDGRDTPPEWLRVDPIFGDLGGVEPTSAMLRTQLANEVGFDTSYLVGEGIEWLSRLVSAGVPVAVCDGVLWRKRIHDGNISQDRGALRLAMLRMVRERIAAHGGIERHSSPVTQTAEMAPSPRSAPARGVAATAGEPPREMQAIRRP